MMRAISTRIWRRCATWDGYDRRLQHLAAIGQFDLLRQLYGRLHIAQSVWSELTAQGKAWPGRKEVATASWIEQHDVENQALVLALRRDLDRGEAETIALALEMDANLVLMDEREGRHAAERMGLKVVGVVGVLVEAKTHGMIHTVKPHLDALRGTAGFYLTESLYRHVLDSTGENQQT